MTQRTRIAMVGAGFWARAQLAAWGELPDAEVVAVCDAVRPRAEALAGDHGIRAAFADPRELLRESRPDVVDIVTPDHSHRAIAELALESGVAAITQKPMAPSVEDAEAMVAAGERAGRPLLVHENWRWQAPLRALGDALHADVAGRPFRARLQFACSFPVFDKQPALRQAEHFILLDLGPHHLDVARFLLGEVEALFCQTASVTPGIRGEDVATVHLRHESGAHSVVELSYASRLAGESFPETFATVECERGSLELLRGHRVLVTTADGKTESVHAPPALPWLDPGYELAQAAIVPCHRNLLAALRGEGVAETPAADNLRTLRLVFAAYESAASGEVVRP